jgi:hypothetical protein
MAGKERWIGSSRVKMGSPAAARDYRIAELETGATLAALNDALEWRGIETSTIVAVRCRPPPVAIGQPRAQYRVIYAR